MTTYLAFNGTPTPAADLSWFEVAPCGCLVGATVVEHHDGAISTPEQAWDQFHASDTKPKIKQDKERGYTVRLGLRADVLSMTDECPHTPAFGAEEPPTPAGWTWQAPNHYAMARDRKHLVQTPGPDANGEPVEPAYGNAVCGKNGSWWNRDLGALAECSKCLKAAALMMVENGVPF